MKGAEVLAAVLHNLASEEQTWPRVLHGDLDVPVRLVVLEADVVAWPVLFDQRVFEEQRFFFAAGHEDLNVGKLRQEKGDLRPTVAATHVLTHARTQAFGLAHVDDLAVCAFKEVDPRTGRQSHEFGFEREVSGLSY